MLSDKEKELLSISYSNNKRIIDIENQIRVFTEKRDDLERYFNKRDYKEVWFMTTFNLIITSAIGATIIKWGLDLDKEAYEYFLLALAAFWVVFGTIEYNIEKNSTKREKKYIEKKYNVTNDNKQLLSETDKKIRNLKKARSKIIEEEKYISRQLEKIKILGIKN